MITEIFMSTEIIHQIYITYYQRPADPAGLAYWYYQDQLNANGGGEAGVNAVAIFPAWVLLQTHLSQWHLS